MVGPRSRDHLLKALGWKVVHIHYQDWDKCQLKEEKQDYLRRKLIEVHEK